MAEDYRKLINSPQFLLEVSKGNIKGHSIIHKFAHNPDIDAGDTEDIWDFGGTYTYLTTGTTLYASSSSAADTQVMTIQGLDSNYREQTIEVTLQGQTKVEIDGTWIRVFRMKNDGATNMAGIVYVYEDDTLTNGVPDTDSKVKAQINNGFNQTLMSHYCAPANRHGYLFQGYASLAFDPGFFSTTAVATIDFKARAFGGVFQTKEFVSISNGHYFLLPFPIPLMFPPKTDFKVKATSSTANVGISIGYDILLIDENQMLF